MVIRKPVKFKHLFRYLIHTLNLSRTHTHTYTQTHTRYLTRPSGWKCAGYVCELCLFISNESFDVSASVSASVFLESSLKGASEILCFLLTHSSLNYRATSAGIRPTPWSVWHIVIFMVVSDSDMFPNETFRELLPEGKKRSCWSSTEGTNMIHS